MENLLEYIMLFFFTFLPDKKMLLTFEKWSNTFSICTKSIDFWYPKIPFWSTDLSLLDIQNNLMKPCTIPVPLWMLWYTRIIFFVSCPWNTLVLKITWQTWIYMQKWCNIHYQILQIENWLLAGRDYNHVIPCFRIPFHRQLFSWMLLYTLGRFDQKYCR